MKIMGLTNRSASPNALKTDYYLQPWARQMVFQIQYCFSPAYAFTMIEAIYLILISKNDQRIEHIKKHEAIISNQKI